METRAARAAAALRAAFVEVESGVCGECVDALTDAQLVEWVKDPDNLGHQRHSLLQYAAKHGNVHALVSLLSRGLDVDAGDEHGSTALMWAAQAGHEAAVALLIEKSASVNAANIKAGNSPLDFAALGGSVEVAALLLENGALVNAAAAATGDTALIFAALDGHEKVAALLLEKRAAIDTANKFGDTALTLAAWKGHEAVVSLLITNGAALDAMNELSNTPLILAASEGHEKVAALLVEKGASVNAADKSGNTALAFAADKGLEVLAALLVEKGASVDAATPAGYTALLLAAERGLKVLAALLIKKGARHDATTRHGDTALTLAAWKGREAVVSLLITNGASFDAVNDLGNTALTLAKDHTAVRELLLRKGALVSLLSSENPAARRSGTIYTSSLSPAVLASHANTIVPLLQSRVAEVRTTALHVLNRLYLPDVVARSKMIARLLTHLGRSFPGIHTPLLHYLDPLTRRSLIEAIAARRNDTSAAVRNAAVDFIRRRLDPTSVGVETLLAALT